jgi:hypothetical protein
VADRPLHIAIDGRELFGKPTGVGRYLLEVLKEWPQVPHRYSVVVPEAPTAPLRQLGDRFQWVVEAGAVPERGGSRRACHGRSPVSGPTSFWRRRTPRL